MTATGDGPGPGTELRPLRVGIVAGEASGDLLGAGLIRALASRRKVSCEGVAGPRMEAVGCDSLGPMERLSVMGLVEVLGRYRELSRFRREIIRHFLAHPPDVFIGVDAPDFNLAIERRLKAAGIPVVHYVSPSVWAWRSYRVRKIARSTDLMLALFPFEAAFYREHGLAVRFVGHPLAYEFPLQPDRDGARRELGLAVDGEVVALLPGSRLGEVRRLAADFFATAAWLARRRPDLRFVVPLVNDRVGAVVRAARETHGSGLDVTFLDGRSREAMTAADAVLLASGTAALEAMLLKRPMVVAYRVARLTALLVRPLMRVDQFSLPNHLAGRPLVPEFLQDGVTPERLGPALLRELTDGARREMLAQEFTRLHELLHRDASTEAAAAILALVDERSTSAAGR